MENENDPQICLTDEEYDNLMNEFINPKDLRCKTKIVESKGKKDYYLTLNSGQKIYLGSNIQGFLTPNNKEQKGGSSHNKDLYDLLEKGKETKSASLSRDQRNRLLLIACEKGNVKGVLGLLTNRGQVIRNIEEIIDVDYQEEYTEDTPLMKACKIADSNAHNDIAEMLLVLSGADPNIENKDGWIAMDFVFKFYSEQGFDIDFIKNTKIYQLLIEYESKPGYAFLESEMEKGTACRRASRHQTTRAAKGGKRKENNNKSKKNKRKNNRKSKKNKKT
mgnify:CR=1 FL=1